MRYRSILAALALSLALGARGAGAQRIEPAPAVDVGPVAAAPLGFGDAFDRLRAWSAWVPETASWLTAAVPTAAELLDPDGWSTRWLVAARDLTAAALADAAERAPALFALLPAPATLDLTTLIASPVPGVESSGFGWRRDPITKRDKFHKGTDFRADRGTPVYSAGAGVVAFTGRQTGYGNVIYVDHGGGVVSRYAHLSRIEVKAGAAVLASRRIGRVGSTGRATGPHLHFEIRLDGRPVDPELAMHVGELQRTAPAAARLAAWLLSPEAQAAKTDRHDPPRQAPAGAKRRGEGRPERRDAPVRDRNRS